MENRRNQEADPRAQSRDRVPDRNTLRVPRGRPHHHLAGRLWIRSRGESAQGAAVVEAGVARSGRSRRRAHAPGALRLGGDRNVARRRRRRRRVRALAELARRKEVQREASRTVGRPRTLPRAAARRPCPGADGAALDDGRLQSDDRGAGQAPVRRRGASRRPAAAGIAAGDDDRDGRPPAKRAENPSTTSR